MNLTTALLQASGGGMTVLFVQMALFVAIFYFLLIRPQRKEQQRHREMLASLAKGDEVVTNGGIIGRIVKADDSQLIVRTGDVELVVERARIARRVGDTEQTWVRWLSGRSC